MKNDKQWIYRGASRGAHEFLFMFNLILLARITEGIRDFWLFRYLFLGQWETKLEFAIESYKYHRLYPNARFAPKDLAGHTAFLVATLLLALSGVLLLRFFSRTQLAKEVLRSFAGLTSVLMLPLCWIYATALYPRSSDLPDVPRPWLYLELVTIATTVILFALTRRYPPRWSLAALILVHHIFWGWLFLGGTYFWLGPFLSLFPLTGLCASMAWLVYVSSQWTGLKHADLLVPVQP